MMETNSVATCVNSCGYAYGSVCKIIGKVFTFHSKKNLIVAFLQLCHDRELKDPLLFNFEPIEKTKENSYIIIS